MDNSQEYIRMCNCPEIQDKAETFLPPSDHFEGVSCSLTGDFAYFDDEDFIWLPRQDQLQEMVGKQAPCGITQELIKVLPPICDTWEKFWLMYVMGKKFKKTWNGEAWV